MPPIPLGVQIVMLMIGSAFILFISYSKLTLVERILIICFIVLAMRNFVLQ